MTDSEFLEALAAKCEQETQVWLGFKNVERAARLRAISEELRVAKAERDELAKALESCDTVGAFERMLDSKFPDANPACPPPSQKGEAHE